MPNFYAILWSDLCGGQTLPEWAEANGVEVNALIGALYDPPAAVRIVPNHDGTDYSVRKVCEETPDVMYWAEKFVADQRAEAAKPGP
ncbi:hypothetical protein ACWFOB_23125 [Bacillus subtilis]